MNYFEKANDFYNLKQYKKAIEMYEISSKFQPNTAVCLYNSAVCFIKLEEYNKAIPLLNNAVKLKRQSSYFFNLGYCYAMIKNHKKSLINFNIAWSLNTEDKDCEKAIRILLSSLIH